MKTPLRPRPRLFDHTALILATVLLALVVVEHFFAPHYRPVFPWHHVTGYMAVIGLGASVVLIALAKAAGKLFLQRAEDADDRD